MSDLHLPGLTKRVAEALKPFVDAAIMLERHHLLEGVSWPPYFPIEFRQAQWRELLAALRESQREAEGVTGGGDA